MKDLESHLKQTFVSAAVLRGHLSEEAISRLVPAYFQQGTPVYRVKDIRKLLNAGMLIQTR